MKLQLVKRSSKSSRVKAFFLLLFFVGTVGVSQGQAPVESEDEVADAPEEQLAAKQTHAKSAGGNKFFQNYCVECHGPKKQKGDVRLDLLSLLVTDENHELWKEIVHNLQRGDMPPEDAKQTATDERRAFLAEAIGALTRYEEDAKSGRDPLTRLTNNQIAHSLQDLLKTHEHIAEQLIGDPVDKHGFSRQSELDLSGSYLQLYADALERIIERAIPNIEPTRTNVFRIAGNDWEKCHWAIFRNPIPQPSLGFPLCRWIN